MCFVLRVDWRICVDGCGVTQASGGSVTVDFGTITNVLYSTGGMLVIAAAALMAVVLLLKNKRELWAKIFVWAGLLLATMLGAAFFSSLASVATNGFSVLLPYIPQVALVVGSVALIAKWDSGEKKIGEYRYTGKPDCFDHCVNRIHGDIIFAGKGGA